MAIELVAITLWLDDSALIGSGGLVGFVGLWGAWILRGLVGFAAVFVTFAWLKHKDALEPVSGEIGDSPFGWTLLAGHFGLIAVFVLLSSVLYGSSRSSLVASGWLATGIAAIALAGFAFIRPAFWLRIARITGSLWIWALAAVLLACISGNSMRSFWPWTIDLTFRLVQLLLSPFVSAMVAEPSKLLLGTPRFSVEIAPQCSGLEGGALMVAFGVIWLGLFRRECRFPHALVLLPAGVAVMFFLNSVRIALLILIGNAGGERIALGGFHSQAGWIIFNLVALGFSVAALRIPWIRNTSAPIAEAEAFENPTTTWLLPWLAILATGILAHALSADFEWFYPLRLLAAIAALLFFWRKYAELDWRIDWTAPLAGFVVFAIWIGFDRFNPPAPETMPAALAAASAPLRNFWLTSRVLSAAITVPIAEELAFRGYLMRRLVAADFDKVDPRQFTWFSLAVSSIVFGAMHGTSWLAGSAAGLGYGWLYAEAAGSATQS